MRLAGAGVVLTGAASGIGAALLRLLAARPARVVAADIDEPRLRAAVAALPPGPAEVHPLACDMARPEQIDRLLAEAGRRIGPIDLCLANAGFATYGPLAADWAQIERIFQVNTFAPIYLAARLRDLSGGRPYKLAITASAMAEVAVPGYALYGATKAALERFAEAYRHELGDPRALMLVYPIATRTAFFARAGPAAPRPWHSQSPERVARAILRGVERDALSVYPSRRYQLTRLLPLRRLIQAVERRRLRRWLR